MPVITISRMFGSGGSEVAARVADTLGWTLLDNALVDRVAARLGRTPVEVQAIEERVPSLAERLADALALGSPEIVSPALSAPLPPTEERLLEVTEHVIDDAIARGPVRGVCTFSRGFFPSGTTFPCATCQAAITLRSRSRASCSFWVPRHGCRSHKVPHICNLPCPDRGFLSSVLRGTKPGRTLRAVNLAAAL